MSARKLGRVIRVTLSEVTEMKNDMVCIAGWSDDLGAMVRPLCGSAGDHWPARLANEGVLVVGNVLAVKLLHSKSTRAIPHAFEDTLVDQDIQVVETLDGSELRGKLAESVTPTVGRLFADQLEEKKYVVEGTRCPSLGALEIDARCVGFENRYGAPRCWFYDGDNIPFNLPLTSRHLRILSRTEGVKALEGMKRRSRRAHIRLGLAGGWTGDDDDFDPPRCYAQVNGIIFE